MEKMTLADLRFNAQRLAPPANALDPAPVTVKQQTFR